MSPQSSRCLAEIFAVVVQEEMWQAQTSLHRYVYS